MTSTESDGAPGPVEAAVRRDLARITNVDVGVRATLMQMAVGLAQSIDSWGVTPDTAAALSASARAHGELRATLAALMEAADDDDDPAAGLPAPVWDSAQRPADAGRPGGGGGGTSG